MNDLRNMNKAFVILLLVTACKVEVLSNESRSFV